MRRPLLPNPVARRWLRRLLVLVAMHGLPGIASPAQAQRADSLAVVERAAAALCDKRIAVLGQLPSHGEARGFQAKAQIVERLVERCGFDAVLFEAPIYDFVGFRAAMAKDSAAPRELDDAIGRFWWTRELTDWRAWLFRRARENRLVIGGLDDQVSVTSRYARATLPGLVAAMTPAAQAAECEQTVTRHLFWRYDAAQRFDEPEQRRLQRCARGAATAAARRADGSATRRARDRILLDNLAGYVERQVGDSAALDRDAVMYRNLLWHLARMPAGSKVIVWTATVHAARRQGELEDRPLGAHLVARWGRRVGVVGFTALAGQQAVAGQPSRTLPALPAGSLEARATEGGATWTWLDAAALRAIGPAPSRLMGRTMSADWSAYFDGVIAIPEEVAPTFDRWPAQ